MSSTIRIIKDIDECAFLWQKYYPVDCLFDLWWVKETFAKFYKREPFFVLHEDGANLNGFLPLCRASELINSDNGSLFKKEFYLFFPGEMWHNRTWMEQNKIIAKNFDVMREMLLAVKSEADNRESFVDIRYLNKKSVENIPSEFSSNCTVDEVGYIFYPAQYKYSYEAYLGSFAGKSRKKILSEIATLEGHGVFFRYNNFDDLNIMFELNMNSFGSNGYFHDSRFLNSFIELASQLNKNGMLRVVTVIIGGKVAAVDMGCVWNNQSIMLAGGTDRNFAGVAKLINLHHIKWACAQKLESLDFLCGDFGWKGRFHLTPQELYQIVF
ncbi:MAG: GNAT family N-acetyltransferase [Desulfamplus sp.]|nr:GNAT family N-acetyltransferase [Desulfamplus sp.]